MLIIYPHLDYRKVNAEGFALSVEANQLVTFCSDYSKDSYYTLYSFAFYDDYYGILFAILSLDDV